MRNLHSVVTELLTAIPADQDRLRAWLEQFQQNLVFTAPEAMGDRWHEVSAMLAHYMPTPKSGPHWQSVALKIWMDEPRHHPKDFAIGDRITDGRSDYTVVKADCRGMAKLLNHASGKIEHWNAYNNPHFKKVELAGEVSL